MTVDRRRCSHPLVLHSLELAFDILGKDIGLQIDLIADFLRAERRDRKRVGNQRHTEARVGDFNERQAHAIYGDAPFGRHLP